MHSKAIQFLLSAFLAIGILAVASESAEAAPSSRVEQSVQKDPISGDEIGRFCIHQVDGEGNLCIRSTNDSVELWFNFGQVIEFRYDGYAPYQMMDIRVEFVNGNVSKGQLMSFPSRSYESAFLSPSDAKTIAQGLSVIKRVVVRIPVAGGQQKVMTFLSNKGNFYKESK